MKKLLTLFTLLLCVCSGAWGDEVSATQSITNSNKTCTWTALSIAVAKNATEAGDGLAVTAKNGAASTSEGVAKVKSESVIYVEVPTGSTGTIKVWGMANNKSFTLKSTETITFTDKNNIVEQSQSFVAGDIETNSGVTGVKLVADGEISFNKIEVVLTTGTYGGGGATTCNTPTFSRAAGAVVSGTEVTISSTTTGSTIYYTTNGDEPTTSSDHGTAGTSSASVTVNATMTIKAIAVKDGCNNSGVASAAYTVLPVIVDTDLTGGASWNFTSYTDAQKEELKSCTDFWNETSADSRYGNKVNLSNEHLRGTDGNELSIATGLKYTVTGENNLRFDPGDNRSWMQDGTSMIIPGLKAGQIVRVDLMTSKGGTARGMTSTNLRDCVGFNSTSVERNVSYGFVEADGDVTLTCNGGLNIYTVEVIPVTVSGTITEAGWNTFSSNYALDLSTITGGTAYVAKTNDNTEVTMTKTTAKIAAGTGIMIKGTAGDTFTISTTTDAATLDADNQLVGLPNGGIVAAGEYNFVFAWKGNVSTAGFYYVDIAAPTLPAGKAYLNSEGVNGAKLSIVIDDTPSQEETDGIKSVQGSGFTVNGEAYNLSAQRVGADYKGLVIINGKKVIRK